MGGQAEAISNTLKNTYAEGMDLRQALEVAVRTLSAPVASGNGSAAASAAPLLDVDKLEVAVLERDRPQRKFRRIAGAALASLLQTAEQAESDNGEASSESHPE
jgi:proteasome alpha subunit